MANLKFSGFTANAAVDQADSFLVGFDTDGGGANPTNNKWTFPQIAAGLAAVTATPFSIYAANGIIGTARTALLTDILRFRDFTNTNDIFTLNSNGTFTLGLGAAVTSNTSIAIGNGTTVTPATSVGIGSSPITSGMYTGSTAIGVYSGVSGAQSVAVGSYAVAPGGGIAIGQGSGQKTGAYSINIGRGARGEGANSITFNSSGATLAEPTTANAFGVYMTSNTSADFEVVGSGTSILRTNLNVTGNIEVDGQAWGDLYDGGTIADGATFTPDWNNGNVQKIVIATGAAITIANGSNLNNGATYILIIEQGGTSGTVTWGGKYQWPANTPPILTSGAGKADVITMLPYNSASILSSSTLDFLTA